MAKLDSRDRAAPVLIEYLEGLVQLSLSNWFLELVGHDLKEVRKVYCSGTILVKLNEDLFHLCLGGAKAERTHNRGELLCRD